MGAAALLAALACSKGERDVAGVDAPSGSAAGSEARTDSASNRAAKTELAVRPAELGSALVAVASTTPGEAEPCERTCGRLGDCLFASEDFGEVEAGGLELECLDLCVHAPDDASARARFLTCEQRQSCGELISCAQASWDELAAVRRAPDIQGITAAAVDPCKDGCRWLYACMISGAPPGEGYLSPQDEEQLRYCEKTCESLGPAERETYAHLAECLPSHCGYGQLEHCVNYN
jgi:hypothetical protein